MKPKPFSELNHLTVPTATTTPGCSILAPDRSPGRHHAVVLRAPGGRGGEVGGTIHAWSPDGAFSPQSGQMALQGRQRQSTGAAQPTRGDDRRDRRGRGQQGDLPHLDRAAAVV